MCLFTFPLLICTSAGFVTYLEKRSTRSDRRYLVKEKRVNHECP